MINLFELSVGASAKVSSRDGSITQLPNQVTMILLPAVAHMISYAIILQLGRYMGWPNYGSFIFCSQALQ